MVLHQLSVPLLTALAILYKGLGMKPKMILALAGVYGTITFVSNVITTLFLTDQWGRRKYVITSTTLTPFLIQTFRMILTGLSGVIAVEIYAAIMQREFQDTDNKVGKGFTILGIYLFAVIYCPYMSPNQESNANILQMEC